METTSSPPVVPAKKQKWLRRLRVSLFVFACLVTSLALYHAEENWRGKRTWDKYRASLERKGDKVGAQEFTQNPVPDAENFAQTPFLAPLYDFLPGTQKHRDTNAVEHIYAFANLPRGTGWNPWQTGRGTDLTFWANDWKKDILKTNRNALPFSVDLDLTGRKEAATAILALLKKDEAVYDELVTASHRPFSQFKVKYDTEDKASILLPHLGQLKRICQMAGLKASAELALNDTEDAARDVHFAFYLSKSIKSEPVLISHLVAISMINLALQPLWEGLAEHRWSEAQLKGFEAEIADIDMIERYLYCVKGERDFFGASMFESFRHTRSRTGFMDEMGSTLNGAWSGGAPNGLVEAAFRILIPTGWSYFEEVNFYKVSILQQSASAIKGRTLNTQAMEANWKEARDFLDIGRWRAVFAHKHIARVLSPAMGNIVKKTAVIQVSLDMARIACALERYRLAQNQYPATLEALAPAYLADPPRDVIGGQSYKYHLNSDGYFVLYSLGWNAKDDGGEVILEKTSTPKSSDPNWLVKVANSLHPVILEGDWVWQYQPVNP